MERQILFLPGTGIPEPFYSPLLRQLARRGTVHRFAYRHRGSMMEARRRNPQAGDGFEALRSEVCFGATDGSRLGISPSEAIRPWYERRVAGIGVDELWRRTLVVGHSQGAGHALLLAQRLRLLGCLMIAGPADAVDGRASPWTGRSSRTPADRMLLLVHSGDAGLAMVIHHARAAGLQVSGRTELPNPVSGGWAVVESRPDAGLGAHGYGAGPKTWAEESPLRPGYEQLLDGILRRNDRIVHGLPHQNGRDWHGGVEREV